MINLVSGKLVNVALIQPSGPDLSYKPEWPSCLCSSDFKLGVNLDYERECKLSEETGCMMAERLKKTWSQECRDSFARLLCYNEAGEGKNQCSTSTS